MKRADDYFNPYLWKAFDYTFASPGMTSTEPHDACPDLDGYEETPEVFNYSRVTRKIEETVRPLKAQVIRRLYEVRSALTEPPLLPAKFLESSAVSDVGRKPSNAQEVYDQLRTILATIGYIEKHRALGDDIAPLAFDLGVQVGKFRHAIDAAGTVRSKGGRHRKYLPGLAAWVKQRLEANRQATARMLFNSLPTSIEAAAKFKTESADYRIWRELDRDLVWQVDAEDPADNGTQRQFDTFRKLVSDIKKNRI